MDAPDVVLVREGLPHISLFPVMILVL